MKQDINSFTEICIYKVKTEKTAEFEDLIQRVYVHHKKFPGVIDVRYIKRTHRPPNSFSDVKEGKPSIKLRNKQQFTTYVLFWELENEIIHGKATKSGLESFYKEFRKYLTKQPTIILGERIR